MKKQFAVIALALSALGAASAAQAGEETCVPPSISEASRAQVRAELASAPTVPDTGETYAPASVSTLSRAQVLADLAAWRAAGLADEWRGEHTPDLYSAEYRAKLASYDQALARLAGSHSVAGK